MPTYSSINGTCIKLGTIPSKLKGPPDPFFVVPTANSGSLEFMSTLSSKGLIIALNLALSSSGKSIKKLLMFGFSFNSTKYLNAASAFSDGSFLPVGLRSLLLKM